MSLVNHETGEIVEPLNRADAERLTTRIRLRLDTIADNYVAVMPLIREAIERQAFVALGYANESQYISECFGDALGHLGVEVRREVVRELTAAGMSTRAIAPVVAVNQATVVRDIATGDAGASPDPAPEFVSATEALAEMAADDTEAADLAEDTAPAPAKVKGLDGKEYARPTPSKPKRSPLTDSFFRAVHDVERRVESLHRLVEDDRWSQNAEKVAAVHRNDLLRINDLLQQVIASLPTQESTR